MSRQPVVRRTSRTHPAPTPQPTPCRLWQGTLQAPSSKANGGYGRRGRSEFVHRWVWEQVNGPIPAGMEVMHKCDNPPCFRLDHLMLGTRLDNARDMATKGRSARGNRPRRETCRFGHTISENADGHRWCDTCQRARHAERYLRKRATRPPSRTGRPRWRSG